MIQTAEEVLEKYQKEFNENGIVFDLAKPMREFAKLHVEAALKEAYDTILEYAEDGTYPSKRSIINSYPLTLIK